ncbi:quinolinate synthase NadA [Eubacterium xylanophilum]|uniref:quinolinate synthase NadA n=1 Tax=Eubacterium xylanophilum TaxID=39497 RepID=UPI00047EBC54|nr:quinolinate synthase NadA [Eubacterium xylanophilum]
MREIIERIEELKKEKNAVILAHYYVRDEVQEIADYVGDSFYLSKVATKVDADIIVFCGVSFMGESAKILNPDKMVLMPDSTADCPMAHMADVDKIEAVRSQYDDLAVVCYINSTSELKMHSDICVTSSNAMKIVERLPQKNIFFIPDENLGRYIASKVPEKNFIFNDGFCHVHSELRLDEVKRGLEAHPEAKFVVHPECKMEVLELADFIGSTAELIDFVTEDDSKEFIVGTEMGVLYEMKQKNPNKKFYSAAAVQICPNMKKISLEKIADCLANETNQVEVSAEKREQASKPLNAMLELAK